MTVAAAGGKGIEHAFIALKVVIVHNGVVHRAAALENRTRIICETVILEVSTDADTAGLALKTGLMVESLTILL